MALIGHEELLQILHYDKESGVFRWRVTRCSTAKAGQVAGGYSSRAGYCRLRINGVLYLAHRLAWFYVHGCWPDGLIDHKDTDPTNNAISNLRLASHAENLRNRGASRNNTSGHKNVFWYKAYGMWQVQVMCDGKKHNGGYFKVLSDAVDAANKLRDKLHGEFASA